MKKKSIFVVDSNKDFVAQMGKLISTQEDMYLIGTANNGKDALVQIKSIKNIDVIITELVMPVMDGFALLNELRNYYFDKDTNEVRGKCKLKPYKSYFAFEVREDNN